ncbi:substrate-binding domain-containing protein [Arthrobacter sp. NPDC057388]|uniref:substrate-binding domain-containing protein n=1 Tax=Arthrobacter sp. NPDC057388 TaxID=3346116 RepID=UPI0036418348
MGFDDIFGADFTSPPLTTICSPLRECGARATGRLLEALQNERASSASRTLPLHTELIVRGSSGRPSMATASPG